MALNIYIKDREPGVITIELDGNLDNSTYQLLEAELEKVLKTTPPVSTIILDFTKLEFISSMGLRVIAKTRYTLKSTGGKLYMVNVKAHIQEVFDVVRAIPDPKIFRSMEEMDNYLLTRQKVVKEDE